MLLEEAFPKAKCTILNNKKIYTVEQFLRIQPKEYHDYRVVDVLSYTGDFKRKIDAGLCSVVSGILLFTEYDRKKHYLKLKIRGDKTENILYCYIYGAYYARGDYEKLVGHSVYIGGKITYSPTYKIFSCFSPDLFTIEKNELRIHPIYRKIQGISDVFYEEMIKLGYNLTCENSDYIPIELKTIFRIEEFNTCVKGLRWPKDRIDVQKAYKRIKYEDMSYFAAKIFLSEDNNNNTSFLLENTSYMDNFIDSFPYELTDDQKNTIYNIVDKAKSSKIYSLVQGDVGCGKTCVAFALMFAFASTKGFQSVLLAPTTILAIQHYNELKEYADKLGLDIVYLASNISKKEQAEAIKKIKEGCPLIVGTHSCFNKSVEYKNLALVITDEEHRFGVLQKQELMNRCKDGVHSVIMSATPIPRTIANSVYGNMIDVYTISQMPNNRKEKKTAIIKQDKTAIKFILQELEKGHQAYIVCPLIEKNINSEKMQNVTSTEEVYKTYGEQFSAYGYKTGLVTGKTKDKDQVLKDFSENKLQVLVATSVIEVGVNVPNATVILIHSAERFGLAALHQLRGRVGRSQLQSYCILKCSDTDKESERLEIMCKTNNGFEIAVEDFKLRGAGDMFGLNQSGNDKHLQLMISNPDLFNIIKEKLKDINKERLINFVNKYEELYKITQQ